MPQPRLISRIGLASAILGTLLMGLSIASIRRKRNARIKAVVKLQVMFLAFMARRRADMRRSILLKGEQRFACSLIATNRPVDRLPAVKEERISSVLWLSVAVAVLLQARLRGMLTRKSMNRQNRRK
mmetsp:Transcript_68775/g.114313  ORF Transcript_68775/g.114313 Transcript_68775/m.114313 type:complete len:127 (+) Transcript_68775:50-430(+)